MARPRSATLPRALSGIRWSMSTNPAGAGGGARSLAGGRGPSRRRSPGGELFVAHSNRVGSDERRLRLLSDSRALEGPSSARRGWSVGEGKPEREGRRLSLRVDDGGAWSGEKTSSAARSASSARLASVWDSGVAVGCSADSRGGVGRGRVRSRAVADSCPSPSGAEWGWGSCAWCACSAFSVCRSSSLWW